MAFDGTLKFDTGIDKSGFESGIASLGGIAKKGMEIVSGAIKIGTDALVSLGKQAVSVGSNFEGSMAQVIATMGVTKDTVQDGVNSYELLKKAASDAGEATTFSASEAAGALNYLALAGYSAGKAAEALPSVLDLAAAGGLDLKYAADLATDAMAALGIEASKDNLTDFGDQLAKTASRANASVAQLGEAILTVGGTAKELAGGTTELNAALGVLANRGIKGAEAGTHLRNMILSLETAQGGQLETLNRLGVSALDAEGKLRPLNKIFADLAAAGAKTQDLNDIFKLTDIASAQAMIAGCGEEFDNLTAEIGSCDGAMSDMAHTMNDTLEGDMKSLGSKAEALGIAVYEGLNEPLRGLAQLAGQYISQLTAAFKTGSFEGIAAAIGDVLGQALGKLTEYLPDLTRLAVTVVTSLADGLKSNSRVIANSALALGKALLTGFVSVAVNMGETAVMLLASLANELTAHPDLLVNTASEIITQITEFLTGSNLHIVVGAGIRIIQALAASLAEMIPLLEESLTESIPLIIDAGISIITALAEAVSENIDLIITSALTVIQVLCESLLNGDNLQKLLDAGLTLLMSITQAIVDNLPLLIDIAIQILTFLCTELLAPDNILKLVDAAIRIVIALTDAIIDNLDTLLIAAEQIISAIWDALLAPENLGKILELGVKLLAELIVGLCQIGGKLLGFAADLFEEMFVSLGSIDWGSLGKAILEGICSGLLGSDFVLSDFLSNFKENWVSGFKNIFGIHSPSKLMHDEVGEYLALGIGEGFSDAASQIGQGITKTVSGWAAGLSESVSSAAQRVAQSASAAFDKLPVSLQKPLTDAGNALRTWGTSAVETGKDAAAQFVDGMIDIAKQLPVLAKQPLNETLTDVFSWGTSLVKCGRDAAQSLVSTIVSAVSSLPDTMTSIGANIVSGLWNGITNMGSWLKDKISGFAGGIISGFKESFGIESPSKVMRDSVGRYIAEGLGVGFMDEIPEIGREAVDAFGDIRIPTVSFEAEWDIPDVPQPDPVQVEIPEIDLPEFTVDAPEIDLPELAVDVPEIEVPTLKLDAPELDIPELPELTVRTAEIDVPDITLRTEKLPQIDSDAVRMLQTAHEYPSASLVQPSPTSEITNNYSYSTVNNSEGSTQPVINVHVHLDAEMDGDKIAEKVAEKVDILQGEAVTMDERGTAH